MEITTTIEKCVPILSSEYQGGAVPRGSAVAKRRLSVTISRQTGSGAHVVAPKLAEYLEEHNPDPGCRWEVYDDNLVEKVLEEHHLPKRFARFMPEDTYSEVAEVLDELLGHRPSSSVLVRQTAETILGLARRGHVILMGRGSNLLTRGLENMLHIRLVASLESRVAHVKERYRVAEKQALNMIQHEDRARRRYLRKHFGCDPDDARLYHMVINTDMVSYDGAVAMIAEAAVRGLQQRVNFRNAAGFFE